MEKRPEMAHFKNKDNEIDSVYSDQTESEYQAYRLLTNNWEV